MNGIDAAEELNPGAKPGKGSGRLHVYWAVALGLLLAGGVLCWKIAMPAMECSRVLSSYGLVGSTSGYWSSTDVIEDLGGPEKAVPKLSIYLRMPGTSWRNRRLAVDALKFCGPPAVPVLKSLLSDEDLAIRGGAMFSLECIKHMKGMTFEEKVWEDPSSAEQDQ